MRFFCVGKDEEGRQQARWYSMALGAGANVLDRKIGVSCSSPVEVATQQTFSILMPIMKGPPGGPGCHYKDPNATV